MRIAARELRIEPHLGQQLTGPPGGQPARHDPVRDQRLDDRRTDPHPRVKAVVRVLEHDLGRAPVLLQGGPAQRGHVFSFKTDLPAGRCHQPDHCPPDRGLAGAALADQPEPEWAGGEPQAHPVDRPDRAEPDREVADLEQRRRRPGRVPRPGAHRPGGAFRCGGRCGDGALGCRGHCGGGALGVSGPSAGDGALGCRGHCRDGALRPRRRRPGGAPRRRRHWPAPAASRGTEASSSAV